MLRLLHFSLAVAFDDEIGKTVMPNSEIARLLNVSPRSVSRAKAQLRETGLWDIVDGGNKPTLFVPTTELVERVEKNEGHQ